MQWMKHACVTWVGGLMGHAAARAQQQLADGQPPYARVLATYITYACVAREEGLTGHAAARAQQQLADGQPAGELRGAEPADGAVGGGEQPDGAPAAGVQRPVQPGRRGALVQQPHRWAWGRVELLVEPVFGLALKLKLAGDCVSAYIMFTCGILSWGVPPSKQGQYRHCPLGSHVLD